MDVFEAAKPWLSPELYVAIDKKKKKEAQKLERIAKTDKENVEVLNMFDVMMKNAGIDPTKLKSK